jgi:hypothetical protein
MIASLVASAVRAILGFLLRKWPEGPVRNKYVCAAVTIFYPGMVALNWPARLSRQRFLRYIEFSLTLFGWKVTRRHDKYYPFVSSADYGYDFDASKDGLALAIACFCEYDDLFRTTVKDRFEQYAAPRPGMSKLVLPAVFIVALPSAREISEAAKDTGILLLHYKSLHNLLSGGVDSTVASIDEFVPQTTPNIPGIIGSIDFTNTALLQLENGIRIKRASGAEGTAAALVQPDANHQPRLEMVNSVYCARFHAAGKQWMDWSSLLEVSREDDSRKSLQVFSGEHTIVLVAQLTGESNCALIDFSLAEAEPAGVGAHRTSILCLPKLRSWAFRQGGCSVDVMKQLPPGRLSSAPSVIIGIREPGSLGRVKLVVDYDNAVFPRVSTASAAIDSAIVGARTSRNAISTFFDGYIWRIQVYDRALTSEECTVLVRFLSGCVQMEDVDSGSKPILRCEDLVHSSNL